jgi:dinuclear metal center YbgI/SA1388 family protein
MKIKDIVNFLESWAPPSLQESYDNSGLLIGDHSDEVSQVLITLDITEPVIDEAIEENCNLIIAHHPLIFKGIQRIGRSHWIDRCIRKAITHNLSIYAIHTNLDNVHTGVNQMIADRLGLQNTSILAPKAETLSKLVVFVPHEHKNELLEALFKAGAGRIGNYDHCSYQLDGQGTFRPNADANPTIGSTGKLETVNESRIEVLIENHLSNRILAAMHRSHPYEEVAYYLHPLKNTNQEIGSGMIGELEKPMESTVFLKYLRSQMNAVVVRHTEFEKEIKRVAICGGSGSFLLRKAISRKADVFITGDVKYHDFFEADQHLMIADIGHYESEQFTKELLRDNLQEYFANFAFRLSKVNTNPIKYFKD